MEAQHDHRPSLMLTLILVSFLSSLCTAMDKPMIQLESRVFVAFKGEDLNIRCKIIQPANTSAGELRCFHPLNKAIYKKTIDGTLQPYERDLTLDLKNLSLSGNYRCTYNGATASWFLRVRTEGYKDMVMWDYTEFSIVAVFTGVLLIFSVVGTVYVFRGHWKEKTTDSSDANREGEKKNTETEEENMDVAAAQSTSFYASLEPRPRSIYDVLDHTAAKTEPKDQKKPNSNKKEPPKPVKETPEKQDEGVFESVYENL